MAIAQNLCELIGNTPLVKLQAVSELTGCNIYGKAEFMNPGGSVKDRTALGIIQAAEQAGQLQAGTSIVEGTAGNTGVGITMLANALGYKSVIVMPQTQSKEKIDLLGVLGATLHLVPATGYSDENHYVHRSRRLAEALAKQNESGAIWANQFDNTANRDIHERTTGQEIWQQTEGNVDGFICSVGTGGTLAGVSSALRKHNPAVRIGIADPAGSSLYNYYAHGEYKAEGTSITEGIGISHITKNLAGTEIDFAYRIEDKEALPFIFDMLKNEGLCLGGSSAINIAGAVRLAQELGPGHNIVTILCDEGNRYQSRLFNPIFLRRKGLPTPSWIVG